MSYIKIKNEYFRTPEFIKFYKSSKSLVYYFLLMSIIRKSNISKNNNNGSNFIYKNYFLNRKLVCYYSQKNIAHYLSMSQPSVSRNISKLKKDGFIKLLYRYTDYGKIQYYQLGTWEGIIDDPSYTERFWLDDKFIKLAVENRHKNNKIKNPDLLDFTNVFNILNDEHMNYNKLKAEWIRIQ